MVVNELDSKASEERKSKILFIITKKASNIDTSSSFPVDDIAMLKVNILMITSVQAFRIKVLY